MVPGVGGGWNRRRDSDPGGAPEWTTEQKKPSRTWRWVRNNWKVASLVTATVLTPPIALEVHYRLQPPRPRARAKKVVDPFERIRQGRKDYQRHNVAKPEKEVDDRLDRIRRMREDVLNIAPNIYSSVQVQLVDGGLLDEESDSVTVGSRVEAIHVNVRSKPWDAMKSAPKVELLHRTYTLLATRYPALTRLVSLRFDDKRQDLDLKFDN